MHRGPRGGASLEDWFDALRFGLPRLPSLAHRLDKETSGCLVLGRHRKALADLNLLFRHGKVGKTYWGVVEGGPDAPEGRIDMPLGRLDDTRGWWMKHDPNGLPSATRWTVLGRADGLTWLALEPLTGRTHQLRVHCMESGFPMLGDTIYGSAPRHGGPGLHLHAREIVVPLYKNKAPVRVTLPARRRRSAMGWSGSGGTQTRAWREEMDNGNSRATAHRSASPGLRRRKAPSCVSRSSP